MASRICNVAEFYQRLSAFFRAIGQTRLADALEKVYQLLTKLGNCEVVAPGVSLEAVAARANEPLTMADIDAALDLAQTLAGVAI